MGMCVPHGACRGQRTVFRSWFSSSILLRQSPVFLSCWLLQTSWPASLCISARSSVSALHPVVGVLTPKWDFAGVWGFVCCELQNIAAKARHGYVHKYSRGYGRIAWTKMKVVCLVRNNFHSLPFFYLKRWVCVPWRFEISSFEGKRLLWGLTIAPCHLSHLLSISKGQEVQLLLLEVPNSIEQCCSPLIQFFLLWWPQP